MYAAMTDVAVFFADEDYLEAVHKLWESVVHRKMYLTGGIGSRHDGEAFGEDYELPNLSAYSETCAAIGNVYWNHRLFLMSGESRYYDVIERSLYNGLLSGISLSGREFFYPNPLESDGHYPFNNGVACTRAPWFNCSCCPTNLVRFIPSVSNLVYARQADSLYVNLYIPGEGRFSLDGKELGISQHSNYPWEGNISLELGTDTPVDLVLKLRIPGWSRGEVLPGNLYSYLDPGAEEPGGEETFGEKPRLLVNGEEIEIELDRGYAVIDRRWSPGDRVELDLPMPVRLVQADPMVEENLGRLAVERGPLVYCAEEADNPGWDPLLSAGDRFSPRETTILSEPALVLEREAPGTALNLVPYYLWSNRGPGKMQVWMQAGE